MRLSVRALKKVYARGQKYLTTFGENEKRADCSYLVDACAILVSESNPRYLQEVGSPLLGVGA